jgi:hypothetical protein
LVSLFFLIFVIVATVTASPILSSKTNEQLGIKGVEKRRRSSKKERKTANNEPFKAAYFNSETILLDNSGEEDCFRIFEFAVSSNHTFNCYYNFIQIDFLLDSENQSSRGSAYLHSDNTADMEYVQSSHCTLIK